MRTFHLPVLVCAFLLVNGCGKPQSSHTDSPHDATTYQRIALNSIATNYPQVNTSELQFDKTSVTTNRDEETVELVYVGPATSGTNEVSQEASSYSQKTAKGYRVKVTLKGQVLSITEFVVLMTRRPAPDP